MYKSNKQFDIILEDIIQSVSPEELKERHAEYNKIRLKMLFDKLFKEGKMTKNQDSSYDVDGNVNLYDLNLRSLNDIPYVLNKVNGDFVCHVNLLTSLEGCPKIVDGDFVCSYNNLTSLEGCPIEIDGSFYCNRNLLTSLEGCPNTVNGSFACYDNPIIFSYDYIMKLCKVGGRIYRV